VSGPAEPSGNRLGGALKHASLKHASLEHIDTEITAPLAGQPCPNCGDTSEGNYCRICGQHKIEHRGSVRALFADTVEDLSLTSELPRTLRALITRPGFLTREYSAGRIARYIPPVRLYVAASLLFFVIMSAKAHLHSSTRTPTATTGRDSAAAPVQVDTNTTATPSHGIRRTTSRGSGVHINTPFRSLNMKLDSASKRLAALPPGEGSKRLRDAMLAQTPTVMFLLLPIFALLLKLLYVRSKRPYAEHLVFAFHTHAFTFILLTVIAVAPKLSVMRYLPMVLLLWIMAYSLVAMKRVYEQGWFKTTVKWLMLGSVYFVIFIIAILADLITAVLNA
jgi:hypothetical protein